MGNAALENDLEVLLVPLYSSPYCVGSIPFHVKNNLQKAFLPVLSELFIKF